MDILQDMKAWLDPASQVMPAFDLAKFQKKVDQITGTLEGFPIVRVVWCPDVYRILANGQKFYEYSVYDNEIDGIEVHISPPRFAIEGRVPADVARHGWDESVLGKMPPEGMYVQQVFIAEHTNTCCDEFAYLRKKGKLAVGNCFGKLRLPDEGVLNVIRRNWAVLLESKIDPRKPFGEAEMTEAAKMGAAITLAAEKRKADRAERVADGLASEFAWAEKIKTAPRYQRNSAGVLVPREYLGETNVTGH